MARKLTRKTAIKKVKRVEEALLNAKMVIDGYIKDLQQIREWLEGPDKEAPKEEGKS